MDVDICQIKGFENAICYDYLENDKQPRWKYKGEELDINEICKREKRKLMIVMNPPYQNVKGFKNNLAIEFFNKVLKLNPDVIVFYYMTESFLRKEIEHYKKSNYKIVSHIFSNAKTTFQLSEWPISQVIFDRQKGEQIDGKYITADRYELKDNKFDYIKTYTYDNTRPNLIDEIDKEIRLKKKGLILGEFSYLSDTIFIGNGNSGNINSITTGNLEYCLLSKGINFNTLWKFFERPNMIFKGTIRDVSPELLSDAITFSLFYKKTTFTNKGQKNYIMPFTAEELGCRKNDLNVLFPSDLPMFSNTDSDEQPFDFREFFHQFEYSAEAKNLYNAALQIFKYYHYSKQYDNTDWNDSFYDITNAIMGKDANSFNTLDKDNDRRITKVRTTKGTKGFGRNTIKYAVASEYLSIFEEFFNARDYLAKKINRQLVEQGLLLWERENIY